MSMGRSASFGNSPPLIFLSHSGKQKGGIVTYLYRALLSSNHRPFFDQDPVDSLRPGEKYPSPILEACQGCKLGVIVLSEDYIRSLWPMLELQHLLSDPGRLIYPLFYELGPAELTDSSKVADWNNHWRKLARKRKRTVLELQKSIPKNDRELQIKLDIRSWAGNLTKLKFMSGLERTRYRSDFEYIEAIVSNICVQLPPLNKYSLGGSIKGFERLQTVIAETFEQEGSMGDDGVQAVGMHGVGGSGKTTLCKAMANFYSKSFLGRSFCLEFPTEDTDIDNLGLLCKIEPILKSLSCHTGADIDQALQSLEGGLRRNKVFLAIDNVWDQNSEYARRIIVMECRRESKILVTSRSKEIVAGLLRTRSQESMKQAQVLDSRVNVHPVLEIPSLTELEAMEVLKSYSYQSGFIPKDCLRSLARSCFFGKQFHPLCLKFKGIELRKQGRPSFSDQEWKSLISGLVENAPEGDNTEQQVLEVLLKSLDCLSSRLQGIFVHMATCEVLRASDVQSINMLLRLLQYDSYTEDEMRHKAINALEYHGLVEIHVEQYWWGTPHDSRHERLVIHDLHRQLAKSKSKDPCAAACGLCAGLHDVRDGEDLSDVSAQKVITRKHVQRYKLPESTLEALFPQYSSISDQSSRVLFPQAQIRYLELGSIVWSQSRLQLGMGNMTGLRALKLMEFNTGSKLQEIEGWEGVPNLVWLELTGLLNLEKLGPIGCLKKLEWLVLINCGLKKLETIVDGDDGKSLVRVGDHFPNLHQLDLTDSCKNLVGLGPPSVLSRVFPALKELRLGGCEKLLSFPDLMEAGKSLCVLGLDGCRELRTMEGSICSLTALQHLCLDGCTNLKSMPDMRVVSTLRTLAIGRGCWRRFATTTSDVMNPPQLLNTNADGDGETSDSRQQNLPARVEVDGHQQSPRQLSDAALHGTGICVKFFGFIHLRFLSIDAEANNIDAESDIRRLKLNLISLPSLGHLVLRRFHSLREISFSSASLLESVRIAHCPCLEEVCGFGAHQTHLRDISFEGCPELVRTPELDCLPSLQRLRITKWQGFSTPFSLQGLRVDDCSSLTIVSGLDGLTSLANLRLHGCTLLTNVSGLAALTSLTDLHLGDCTALTNVSGLAGLTSLTSLDLVDCRALTDVSSLAGLTSLTDLVMNVSTKLTDVSSLAALTSLTSLMLFGCCALPGLAGLTSLTYLCLGGRYALTDVSDLAGLTSLTDLHLYNCTSLTNVSGLAGLTSLTEIRLSGCEALTDISGLAGLTSLTNLAIWGSNALTDVSALAGLTSLTDLHIWGLTDLSALAGLTSLRRLRLRCLVPPREFPNLKHLTGLAELTITQNSLGTLKEEDVRQLVSAETYVEFMTEWWIPRLRKELALRP